MKRPGISSIESLPELVRALYKIVSRLEDLFPGRRFTLDGHLVGSIGEVLAEHRYGLALLSASTPDHDARAADGRLVQIKATQAKSVGLRSEPQHLIVLGLDRRGEAREIFNGPGSLAWANAGRLQRNGQRPISVSRLDRLKEQVPKADRLPTVPTSRA